MIRAVLPLLLLGSFFSASAQNYTPEEQAVVKVVKDFATAYSDLSTSKDKTRVLQLFNRRMVSNMNFIRIGGRVNVVDSDYEKFENHLESLVGSELSIYHEITEIFYVSVKNDVGVVSYQNNFEVKKGDETLSKGVQLVTITQKKIKDSWMIILYDVTEIEDAKLKGKCLCELFESTDAGIDYVSKVVVPGGTSYNTSLDNFLFRRTKEKKTIIKTGNQYFEWDQTGTGEVFPYNADTKQRGDMIGANSEKRQILITILEFMYSDKCTNLITK